MQDRKHLRQLTVLSVLYLIIEMILNYIFYKQLSYRGSIYVVQIIEFWAKVITGLGLGLIATRFLQTGNNFSFKFRNSYLLFFLSLILTIPLSFVAQKALITWIVEQSDLEDRNRAVLITTTHGTLVPFYKPVVSTVETDLTFAQKLKYPFSDKRYFFGPINHSFQLDPLINAAEKCAPISQNALGIKSDIDKAFFPYISYTNSSINIQSYKNILNEYYDCMLKDKKYLKQQAFGLSFISELHHAWSEYQSAVNKYNKASKYAKDRADLEWRKGVDEFLGFKSTLPPNLGRNEFFKHPDVKKYHGNASGLPNLYYYDEDFHENARVYIKDNLMNLLMPSYVNSPSESSVTNADKDDSTEPMLNETEPHYVLDMLDEDQRKLYYKQKREEENIPPIQNVISNSDFEELIKMRENEEFQPSLDELAYSYHHMDTSEHQYSEIYTKLKELKIKYNKYEDAQKQAYKALVMPIIAIGLSVFFLILNAGLLLISLLSKFLPKSAVLIFSLFLALWFFTWPLLNQVIKNESQYMHTDSLIIKWIYYHEANLAKLYRIYDDI